MLPCKETEQLQFKPGKQTHKQFKVFPKSVSVSFSPKEWRRARNNAVAKRYLTPVDRNVYFDEVKLQMDAKLWGEEYNRHNPPKQVDICMMAIIEFIDRPSDQSNLYHIENFIEGHYVKYNSNGGYVLDDEALRQTPQAFSHFTFERSGHELMVVDIQGVGDLYTDPQIHTVSGKSQLTTNVIIVLVSDDLVSWLAVIFAAGCEYGDGNLGTRGMALFFHTHHCNSICSNLGLTRFDLAPSELNILAERKNLVTVTISRGSEDVCLLPTE